MKRASIRDLRTSFPKVRRLVEEEGQLLVTERGRPIMILRAYDEPAAPHPQPVDYLARLRSRMPKPLSAASRRALDEASRGER